MQERCDIAAGRRHHFHVAESVLPFQQARKGQAALERQRALLQNIADAGKIARSMRHDPGRAVLKYREQRHHIVAVASRQDDFIGGNNSKIRRAGADHLHGRSPRAARENLHVQPVLGDKALRRIRRIPVRASSSAPA